MTSESEKSKEKKQNQLQRRLEELNTNYNFFLVDLRRKLILNEIEVNVKLSLKSLSFMTKTRSLTRNWRKILTKSFRKRSDQTKI